MYTWVHQSAPSGRDHLQGGFYPGEIGILRVLPGQKPGGFAGPGTKTRLFCSVRDPESQLKQRPGSDQPQHSKQLGGLAGAERSNWGLAPEQR